MFPDGITAASPSKFKVMPKQKATAQAMWRFNPKLYKIHPS